MADIMLSDYTINTMLYHMHRVSFFVLKIGPDTPVFGRFMRLTCEAGDNDDDELVQMLIDFNMCIQTLLPKKHEEYPDEKVDMVMRTMRAPSVTIYENATIILEHIAKLEFYVHANKKKLGTFKATSTVQINVNSEGEIIKAKLTLPILTLTDIGTDVKSGSAQEFLDTLTGLVKDNVPEPVNKKLEKGCKLDFPPGVGGIQFVF